MMIDELLDKIKSQYPGTWPKEALSMLLRLYRDRNDGRTEEMLRIWVENMVAVGVASQTWEPISLDEAFRLPDLDPTKQDFTRPARGSVFYTFLTPDGERIMVALPDDLRICRRVTP